MPEPREEEPLLEALERASRALSKIRAHLEGPQPGRRVAATSRPRLRVVSDNRKVA